MLLRWGLEALCSKTGSELPASWCVPKRGRLASNARLSLSPRKAAAKRRPAGEDTRFGRGGTEASRRSGGRRGPRTLRTRSALRDGPRHAGARAVALIGDVLTLASSRPPAGDLSEACGQRGAERLGTEAAAHDKHRTLSRASPAALSVERPVPRARDRRRPGLAMALAAKVFLEKLACLSQTRNSPEEKLSVS